MIERRQYSPNFQCLSSPQVVVFPIPGGPLINAARALMFCQESLSGRTFRNFHSPNLQCLNLVKAESPTSGIPPPGLKGAFFCLPLKTTSRGQPKQIHRHSAMVQTQHQDCIVWSPEALHGFERSTCSKSWLVSEIPPNGKIRLEICTAATVSCPFFVKAHHPNLAATPSASLRSAVGGKMLCTVGHMLNPNCKCKE